MLTTLGNDDEGGKCKMKGISLSCNEGQKLKLQLKRLLNDVMGEKSFQLLINLIANDDPCRLYEPHFEMARYLQAD